MRTKKMLSAMLALGIFCGLFVSCSSNKADKMEYYKPDGVYKKISLSIPETFTPSVVDDIGAQETEDEVILCGKLSDNIAFLHIDKESNKTTAFSTNLSGFPMAFCALDNGYALLTKDGKQSEIFIKLLLLSENMEVYGEADLPGYYFNDESICRMWYSDGNFYIASEGSDSLISVSESDMASKTVHLSGKIINTERSPDSTVYVLTESSIGVRKLWTVESNTLREIHSETDWRGVPSNRFFLYDSKIYYISKAGMAEYGTGSLILDFVNSGLVYSNVVSLHVSDVNTLYCLYRSPLTKEYELYRMEKMSDEMIPAKKLIEVTYMESGKSFVELAVTMFNAISEEYYAVCDIRSYASNDVNATINEFEKSIVKNDIGDVLVFTNEEYIQTYSDVFLDLSHFTDTAEYFDCVTDSLKSDEKFYALSPYFIANTLVGRRDYLPSGEWTIAAFLSASDSIKDGYILNVNSRSFMQEIILMNRLEDYIDGTKNTFNSPEFASLLEYLGSFPEENQVNLKSRDTAYMSGECLLKNTSISAVNLYLEEKMRFGVLEKDKLFYIGYPNDSGTGTVSMNFGELFAVNRTSAVKDGAWEFINFVMNSSDLILNAAGHSQIPSSKAVFWDWIAYEGALPYVLNPTTFEAMPLQDNNPENYPVVTIDEKFKNEYYKMIDSLTACSTVPSAIKEIVNEEISAYYAGLHSAEETGKYIWSRVSLYLNENE